MEWIRLAGVGQKQRPGSVPVSKTGEHCKSVLLLVGEELGRFDGREKDNGVSGWPRTSSRWSAALDFPYAALDLTDLHLSAACSCLSIQHFCSSAQGHLKGVISYLTSSLGSEAPGSSWYFDDVSMWQSPIRRHSSLLTFYRFVIATAAALATLFPTGDRSSFARPRV